MLWSYKMEMITNWSDEFEHHVTVTDDHDVEYQYNMSVKRVNVRVEDVLLEIRRHEYPDCPFEHSRNINSFETWIADGAWIDEETQAEPIPWDRVHPPMPPSNSLIDWGQITADDKAAFDAAPPTAENTRTFIQKTYVD
jgi:hypothetical protein